MSRAHACSRMLRGAVTLACLLTLARAAEAPPSVPPEFQALESSGKYREADALAAELLTRGSPTPAAQRRLEFERERLRRIRLDYPLTREDLFAALRAAVRDLTETEFASWLQEGRFDGRPIDGTVRYLKVSVSNLFFRHPELETRRVRPRGNPAVALAMWTNAVMIREGAKTAGRPCVLPKGLAVRMVLRISPEAWRPTSGSPATARVWLPVPRRYPFQDDLHIVRSEPEHRELAPPESPIRSIYFERALPASAPDAPLEFSVDYEYRTQGVWFELDPAKSRALSPGETEPARYLEPSPHVVFSPEMRRLGRDLAGAETNPVRRAKRFYDWIAANIRYSFAPEYSTLRNLGEFCRSRRYGDCGMEALLFITLCRMNGIPARWQSGWNLFPGAETIHDWCEIYLAPWGWVPVDPYMGIYATQYATALTPTQQQDLRDFYFGGLSQYRMSANSDHQQALAPAKQAFRSDDVDFQRGEAEIDGRNLYFNEFSYSLDWHELP